MIKFILLDGQYLNIYQITNIEQDYENVRVQMSNGTCAFVYDTTAEEVIKRIKEKENETDNAKKE